MVPQSFQIFAESEQLFALFGRELRSRGRGFLQPMFHLGNMVQRVVPPLLQFCGDQTVLRFCCLVLPLNAPSFVARLLQCQFERMPLLIGSILAAFESIERGLYAEWTQCFEHLGGDLTVDPSAGEGDATGLQLVGAVAAAPVAGERPSRLLGV